MCLHVSSYYYLEDFIQLTLIMWWGDFFLFIFFIFLFLPLALIKEREKKSFFPRTNDAIIM